MLVFVNINGVQDKDVVVVFGKGDDETLGSNLQATAAGNLKFSKILRYLLFQLSNILLVQPQRNLA